MDNWEIDYKKAAQQLRSGDAMTKSGDYNRDRWKDIMHNIINLKTYLPMCLRCNY